MKSIKENADVLLYGLGLLEELKRYGDPHIIGSYRMDVMSHNDLDIDVCNENMSMEKMYGLTGYILERFSPSWYEAKQEVDGQGKTVWFHGFEAVVNGELWNVDIWFFDQEVVQKAEAFCDKVKGELDREPDKKAAVLSLKRDLMEKGLYTFEHFTSMDVYNAVLEQGIRTVDEFLTRYKK